MYMVVGLCVKRWNAKSEFWSSADGHAVADNFVTMPLLTFRWLYHCTCYLGRYWQFALITAVKTATHLAASWRAAKLEKQVLAASAVLEKGLREHLRRLGKMQGFLLRGVGRPPRQ
jgi:hypothetical protein